MNQDPTIEEAEDACTLSWAIWGISATLSRYHESRSKDLSAEVKIKNAANRILTQGRLNLLSPRSRQEWIARCAKLHDGPNWDTVFEWVTTRGVQFYRHSEPVIALSGDYDETPVPFRLNPLLCEQEPTIIYGPGGSGKSYLALLSALLMQRGSSWAGLSGVQGNVLYLDWESSELRIQQRVARLNRGVSFTGLSHVQYRHCLLPLPDDLPGIRQAIAEYQVSVLIIDSLGIAASGEDFEAAIRFFRALRQLHCSSLIVAHVAKHAEEKTVYGSVFFHNLARSVWEVIKAQETDDGGLTVSLQHRKANDDRLHEPLGFRFIFGQSIQVESVSVDEVPEFQAQGPLWKQIENCLLEGPKTKKQIVAEIGRREHDVRTELSRGAKATKNRAARWACSDDSEPLWRLLRPVN